MTQVFSTDVTHVLLVIMKAALLLRANDPLVIDHVDMDSLRDDEVLVRVVASGLCHSDLHFITGDLPISGPTILGHEVAGLVEATGDKVTQVSVGDKVVACTSGFCAHCRPCLNGRTHLCADRPVRESAAPPRITLGGQPVVQGTRVGGFAEKVMLHENSVVKVPGEIPFDRAALLGCGVLTGLGTVFNSAQVRPGSRVAVFGCGGVGLNIIQGARIAGAGQIIAVDISPAKLELATRFGATHVVAGGEDAADAVLKISGGGVDFSFEAIGLSKTIEQAMLVLDTSGLLTMVGVTALHGEARLPVFPAVTRELRIQGALMGSAPFKRDIPKFADMYLAGLLDLDTLISDRISLAEVNSGFAAMRTGTATRSVIMFD